MNEHKHGTTNNTDDVYRTFVGCKVKGLVREITIGGHHTDILVFECGWGLAFNSNGSHWTVQPSEIQEHIRYSVGKLNEVKRETEHLLELAGE